MRRLSLVALLALSCTTSSPGPQRAPAAAASAVERDPVQATATVAKLERARVRATALVPYLAHEDASVRARTALALARLADPEGAPSLITALGDKDAAVRGHAAFALGALDQELPLLLDQIHAGHKGSDAWVRQAAQTRAQAERALDARLHVEQNPRVREQVYAALGQVVIGPGLHHIYAGLDEEGLNAAYAALAYGVHAVRRGKDAHKNVDLFGKLIALGHSPLAEVRFAAVYALARHETCQAQELFPTLLRADADARVRTWAARGLGACDEGADALVRALDDEDWRVQVEALRALGRRASRDPKMNKAPLQLAADRAVAAILAAPDSNTPAAHVLGTTLSLLDDDGLRRVERVLTPASGRVVTSSSVALGPVRCQVAIALASRSLDLKPLARCSGQTEPEVTTRIREVKALALAAQRSAPLRTRLHPYLSDADPRVRIQAVLALGEADDAATRTLLRTRLAADDDAAVIEAVADALTAWPEDPSLVDDIQRALERTQSASDAAVLSARATLARALVTHGKSTAAQAIALLADTGPVEVRNAVRRATGRAPVFGMAPRFGTPPAVDPRGLRARMHTVRGSIEIELFADETPETAAHFVQLARTGFFNGLSFHRVVAGFVVQGGDPRGDGFGGPGYAIPDEITPRAYERGTLGMALAGRDTGGSQFFFTQSRQPHLDGRYTAFGRVTSGMEVVDTLLEGDAITGVDVEAVPARAGPLGSE
ncbi:MAG: peptidylprolyl isomerase [Pseudomonadota bacterium]